MIPSRHPPDGLLLDYAVGNLTEAPALVVATHLALCPDCRRTVSGYEALGGALLENMDPTSLSAGALEAVLDLLGDPDPPGGPPSGPPSGPTPGARPLHAPRARPADGSGRMGAPVLPEPLRSYAGGDADSLGWKRHGGGMEEVDIGVGAGAARTRLLRLDAGTRLPRFGRADPVPAPDLIMVLAGSLDHRDEGVLRRGDVLLGMPDGDAGPVAQAGEACVCVVVSDVPLRPGGVGDGEADLFF